MVEDGELFEAATIPHARNTYLTKDDRPYPSHFPQNRGDLIGITPRISLKTA
jgi:hypothetical protein